jgi:signal transduction histidine kinase
MSAPAPAPPAWWRQRFRHLAVRHKLLAMALLPLLAVLPLLGWLLLWWGEIGFDRLLITKVRADLAVAHGYFEQVLDHVGTSTRAVADSHALHVALQGALQGGAPPPVALLQGFKQREGFDFVALRGPDGRLRGTDAGPTDADDRDAPTFPTAHAGGSTGTVSIELLTPAQQQLLAPALRGRVAVPLLATRNAQPTGRTREERAMVLLATHEVRDMQGRRLGYVQGGLLLNRNLPFIDHINEIVYPAGSLPFGSQGTATLFLDDVRISTNVRLFGGEGQERAIGTRVSQTVRDAVLGAGRTWLDRAFVVDDWYVSAYEPVVNGRGQRIGMLYVGYLEQPFTRLKLIAAASVAAVFCAAMVAAAVVSLRWARAIFAPLERMEATMQRVEGGALAARVGPLDNADEIGTVAAHLDRLLDAVDEKTRALQQANDELDRKVVERTAQLQAAQAQLVRSEKLAAIGQLTASIAHEVNNPIAVIQGNMDLLRDLLGPAAQPVAAELKLVDEQVERMRLIVTQLLQYARPGEYAGYVEPLDSARVIADSVVLVEHLLQRERVALRREFHATRRPQMNRQELQQVLINLMVNALQAMPGGGTLTLRTRDTEAGIAIDVADTGPGLTPEVRASLFQPFVTTKRDGTGLGLWISRSIVERYGGDIEARSGDAGTGDAGAGDARDGQAVGSVFTVRLPA